MPDLDTTAMADCDACGAPATHHDVKDDGTLGRGLIDQMPCAGYRDPTAPAFGGTSPPNRYGLPDASSLMAPATGPGQQSQTPDARLEDVLVNYEEIFHNLHGRYFQDHAQQMQEIAELRAGFNQAVARMQAAEAENEALKALLTGD